MNNSKLFDLSEEDIKTGYELASAKDRINVINIIDGKKPKAQIPHWRDLL